VHIQKIDEHWQTLDDGGSRQALLWRRGVEGLHDPRCGCGQVRRKRWGNGTRFGEGSLVRPFEQVAQMGAGAFDSAKSK
jgi:hypothetical protein